MLNILIPWYCVFSFRFFFHPFALGLLTRHVYSHSIADLTVSVSFVSVGDSYCLSLYLLRRCEISKRCAFTLWMVCITSDLQQVAHFRLPFEIHLAVSKREKFFHVNWWHLFNSIPPSLLYN
ncbi:hypothetical protein J3R30DRAFT_3637255 [Lentinula aciculospora]|uniref:Uncharacterized protein n=1 Tax=Lentinula aciculospora TaxID=153920 RepID=A0A9W8ZQW2_9AGAR|nr:hypothetical protein J3R30DRAFT_3637255 [Lentinula aciculospora]